MSNKYNPDVLINFNNLEYKFRNINYELKNDPYNLIIEQNNKKSNNNFEINLENEQNTKEEFNKILKERNIKTNKVLSKEELQNIKNKFKLKNTELINCDIPNDFDDIKSDFKSDFEKQDNELKKSKEKFNNIIDNLLEEGLLE